MKDKGIVNPDLRKALTARRTEMDQQFNRHEGYFKTIRDWVAPSMGKFSGEEQRETLPAIRKVIDTKARKSQQVLAAGLKAGLTSPSRPWFTLGIMDKDLQEYRPVKEWLHEAARPMYDIFRESNMYRILDSTYRNLGVFGVSAGLVVPNFENVVLGHSFPMGRYRIAEDAEGNIGYLHRDARMSVIQIVAQFGLDNVSMRVNQLHAKGNYHDMIDIRHAIERRTDRNPESPLSTDMIMASAYWEKDQEKFLDIGGFSTRNLMCPRWEQTEGEVWPTSSPGMNALGDAAQLQQQHKDKGLAIEKMHKPPLQGGSGSSSGASFIRNVPGGITTLAVNDLQKGGLRPLYEVKPDVQWLSHDINETRQRISESFFEDLFLMISTSDRRQITAREIAERHEEKLLMLGPVLENVESAGLGVAVKSVFHYAQEADLLPEPPPELDGAPITVTYHGLLAQAQKAVGVAPIERTIGFVGTLAQFDPNAWDKIDTDKTIDEFADQVGPPPDLIRSDDDVAALREQRAQAQQAQQLMENAQPLANAAKLVSEASARGQQGLQDQGRPV